MATQLLPDTSETISGDPELHPEEQDYVPEGFDSVDDFLEDMRDNYKADVRYDSDNRDSAFDDKKFWSGDQWDPLVLQYRKNLPCLTINSLPQFTGQITGDWRLGRASIKVLPAEDGDVDIAQIRADLIRNIEIQSRADRAIDNAFESMVVCGDGAYRIGLDYAHEDVFDQDIVIKPIADALSVVWDRMSVDPTGRDAMHCFVDDMMPQKTFEERWPDEAPSTLSKQFHNSLRTDGWFYQDSDCELVKVTEYWRIIERPRLLAMFADGAIEDVTDAEDTIGFLIQQHGPIVRTREAPCRYAQMHLVTGYTILEGPVEYKLTRLPIIRMAGRTITIGDKRIRFGIVRDMKDPVRTRNFWRSKEAEYLGYATKAKWKAFAAAIKGRESIWRNSHLNDDTLLVANDGAPMPEEVMPPQFPAALANAAQQNTEDMKQVSGIYDSSLGARSNETSGVAINARQREGDVASITYHDNGNAAVQEGGDVTNQLIGQVYDGTRTVRLVGEDQIPRLQRINDPMDPKSIDLSKGRYDVTITTGPSFTTRRVEAAAAAGDFMKALGPQAAITFADLYANLQEFPDADKWAERAKKLLPPGIADDEEGEGPQVPPEMMAQMQQMNQALQQLQAENEALKQDKGVDVAKVQIDAAKVGVERYKAITDRMELGIQVAESALTPEQLEPHEGEQHQMPDGSMMGGPPMAPNMEPSAEYLG